MRVASSKHPPRHRYPRTTAAARRCASNGGARGRPTRAERTAASGFPPSATSPPTRRASSRPSPRTPTQAEPILVLDSDGGSVLGTLALGRAIRKPRHDHHHRQDDGVAAGPQRRSSRHAVALRQLRIDVRLPAAGRRRAATCRRRRTCSSIRSGSARSASRRWNRTIRPRSSTSSSATSGASCNTPSKWAAAASCWKRRCGFRRGSRCIGCPPTSCGA